MGYITCPVCGMQLKLGEKVAKCPNGHSFDRAKQGYFNLLMSQSQKTRRHGDDAVMVKSRRDFLSKEYYGTLAGLVAEEVKTRFPAGGTVLDIGCGEGYYTSRIYEANPSLTMICVDISKDAAKLMASQCFPHTTIVASAYSLPIEQCSIDMVVNIFAPIVPEEIRRVLKRDGMMLLVVPEEKHLFSLKSAIYDKPYKNPPAKREIEGFEIISEQRIGFEIYLKNNEDIEALFKMTPYYYKTGAQDQRKLENLAELRTYADFRMMVFKKLAWKV